MIHKVALLNVRLSERSACKQLFDQALIASVLSYIYDFIK
jgi:hypothetical protein